MGLPIIATNWSGPTEYLTEENGYPVEVEGFDEIESGAFRGHRWARPKLSSLRAHMRSVVDDPDEAKRRGARARKTMVDRFCLECVGRQLLDKLNDINYKIK